MKLSTKGRYAVTAMMDLVLHEGEVPVTLAEISQSQGISLSYLEQLFARLRRAGLVSGVRGPGGGYRLARAAAEISVGAIIEAVDDSLDVTRCRGRRESRVGDRCLTHDLWCEISCEIRGFLSGISLADLAARPGVMEAAVRQDAGTRRRHPLTLHS